MDGEINTIHAATVSSSSLHLASAGPDRGLLLLQVDILRPSSIPEDLAVCGLVSYSPAFFALLLILTCRMGYTP